MVNDPKHAAAIPNPTLMPFAVLIGEWKTVGTHLLLPGMELHGHTSFQWLEGGAFLEMRSVIHEPEVPNGIAIFGSDNATREFFMLYFDERGVSRKYDVSLQDNLLKWWRNAPGFAQRYTSTIAEDGLSIVSRGELSRDGITWEKDLELTYTRMSAG